MASDQAKELRKQGIAAAKAGQTDQARQLLQQSLRIEPQNEASWLWLVSLAKDQREKMFYLNRLLEINPNNDMGLQALRSLGMTREQLTSQVSSLPSRPDNRATLAASAQPGIPMPDAQRISQLQNEVDEMLREYLASRETAPTIQWVQKTKGRAGERDIWGLRAAIAAGVAVSLVVLFLAGYGIIWNTPALRGIVFVPTPTLTFTPRPPTATATATPGDTPTPSPTPKLTLTPSATVPPQIPNGNVAPPLPTKIFPPAFAKGVQGAIVLLDHGRFDEALPTLQVEITSVANSFDPAPYYFAALSLIGQKQYNDAKQVMLDAKQRLTDTSDADTKAVVNGALAYTYYLSAKAAIESGNSGGSAQLLAQAEEAASTAIDSSPRFDLSYLAQAGSARLTKNYDKAIKALDTGLAVPELQADVKLLVEKGEIYFEQKQYDKADYQAFLALYIDPSTESALKLRIKSAVAQDKAGLAVIYSQAYLYYYPGSVEGYINLAQARMAEGKNDLALQAFSQALTGGDNADVLLARADLYLSKNQYKLAQADLSKAFDLTKDDKVRAKRMETAFAAGDTSTAQNDAEALVGTNVIPDAQLKLMQARILIDKAKSTDKQTYQDAADLLTDVVGNVPSELQPIALEYQAKAAYTLGQYDVALKAIEGALAQKETGTRHYIHGLVLEAQGKKDAAIREYDWVMRWSTVYSYPFIKDVQTRLDKLK
ncbi:MAG: tetratricopeptide repeat protein [Anaerolineaceae bacterium]|nr:tetratricopeptide repeat protein [Anaerolineaceae bacterium]